MELQRPFSYQFEDKEWVSKLAIGALISLVPILNFAFVGYMVAIIRNVASHDRTPLPHWDDLGSKFRDGLILTLAGLVYAAPALLLFLALFAVLIASGAASQSSRFQELGRFAAGAGIAVFACTIGFLLLYSLLLSVLRPIILVIFSREGTFASCFRLGEILHVLRQKPGPFFTTWIVLVLAGLAIGLIVGLINLVVGWIPCLGWIVGFVLAIGATIYLLTVDAYLFGQFRLEAFEGS